MQRTNFFFIVVLLLSIFACKNDLAFNRLETPEGVIEKWQGLVDSSQFEAAKQFSTARAIKWLDKNKAITETGDSMVYPITFKSVRCKINGDSASCDCIYTMPEDSTSYRDTYLAKKINGKWLVDLSQDELEVFE